MEWNRFWWMLRVSLLAGPQAFQVEQPGGFRVAAPRKLWVQFRLEEGAWTSSWQCRPVAWLKEREPQVVEIRLGRVDRRASA